MGEGMNHVIERYKQWKRMDLSAIALETMPKQVDRAKVLDDLQKLHSDFVEDLNEETSVPAPKPFFQATLHEPNESSIKTSMEKKQSVSTSLEKYLQRPLYHGAQNNASVEVRDADIFQQSLPFTLRNYDAHFLSFQM
jgi:hypothetical protein